MPVLTFRSKELARAGRATRARVVWNNTSPVEPTDTMLFSGYGITGFDVQYWDGSAWVTVVGGSITGNNKVWTKISFPGGCDQ